MFQTSPFYGLVLLWPQLSVYGAPAWGPDEFYITLHAPLKKHCDCGRLQRAFIVKLFFWAARSVRSSMRKFWRMCQPTRPATWRRWNPFLNSRRRRKEGGSAFWNRPSSPSTGTSMSPTMRGEQRSATVQILRIGGLLFTNYYSLSVKAVYNDLHQTLMSINEQEDLKWWKNNHGPGMPTDWPKVEVCLTRFLHKQGAISKQPI